MGIARFTVRIPEELKKDCDTIGEERNLRLNTLIIIALEEYVNKFRKTEELKSNEWFWKNGIRAAKRH